MRTVQKPWGHETIWAHTDRYVGKILHIKAGHALSVQYHRQKDETVYLLAGGVTATTLLPETRELLEDALKGLLATWRLTVQEKAPELIPMIRRFEVDRDRQGVAAISRCARTAGHRCRR